MHFNLSLTVKVIALCAVPLLLQLGMLSGLIALQNDAEKEMEKATRARSISEGINLLAQHVIEVQTTYGAETQLVAASPSEDELKRQLDRLRGDYEKLKTLLADEPEKIAMIRKSEASAEKAFVLFLSLRSMLFRKGGSAWDEREPIWAGIRECGANIVTPELMDIGRNERAQAERSPQNQKEFRNKTRELILAGAAANSVIAIVLAVFLTRAITIRLKKIYENTVRLASNLPLNPAIGGTDEIASLDTTFHAMAAELNERAKMERALVENAYDCICSIDEDGTIVSENRACEGMFAYERTEMLGLRFLQLVQNEHAKEAYSFLSDLKEGGEAKQIELTMKRRDGSLLDAHLSAQWSDQERKAVCIIRDQSEQVEAERIKQEVMAMVTHDLRSPLMVINNFFQFLKDGFYGQVNERGQKFLPNSISSCNRLLALVNDLLDAEKMRSGMTTIEPEATDLAEIVNECVEFIRPLAKEKSIEVQVRTESVIAKVDHKLITRVLINLLSNAINHSDKAKTVEVTTKLLKKVVEVSVIDSGPGIPEDQLESIFERFYQIRGNQNSKAEGSGLGLTICKSIVQLHGGKIWVENRQEKGSKFTFSLPVDEQKS